ncbi:MAG: T9SS type A sorting domain-containing protein [Crocinitomicaceae bacterium]
MKKFSFLWLLILSYSATAQTVAIESYDCGTTMTVLNELIRCNGIANIDEYEFEFTEQVSGTITTLVRGYHTASLAMAGLTTYGVSYDVRVRAKTIGNPYGPQGASCVISAPGTVPTSELTTCIGINPPALALFNSTFKCKSVFGATGYEFRLTPQGGGVTTTVLASANRKMSLSTAGLYTTNTIYEVTVAAITGGVTGPHGGICLVKAPASLPSTSLEAACGQQLNTFGQSFKAVNVPGASEYEFEYTNQAGGAPTTHVSGSRTTTLTAAGISTAFAAYDVRVRVRLGTALPAVYTNYGATCVLFTPTIVPLTNLDVASCGLQTIADTDPISANAVGSATQYRFIFENLTDGLNTLDSITVATTTTSLNAAGLTDPNTTYRVRVKAEVAGDFGIYGTSCFVHSPQTIPTPELNAMSCNATLTSFSETFRSIVVPGATEYTFEFTDITNPGSPAIEYIRPNHQAKLITFGLLTENIVYNVRVKAQVAGAYGNYGNVCTLTSPAIPTTGITSCGATLTAFNDPFTVTTVGGATEYEFQFTGIGSASDANVVKGFHTTTLAGVGLLEVGASYTLEVRAKVGGIWGNYGAPCTLNAPTSVPTTQVVSDCGTVIPSFNTFFLAQSVAGATQYKFRFTNLATVSTPVESIRGFQSNSFGFAGIVDLNTPYSVEVLAIVNGVEGTYGPACTITTPGTLAMALNDGDEFNSLEPQNVIELNQINNDSEKEEGEITFGQNSNENSKQIGLSNISLNVYPNPTSDIVNIVTDLNQYNVSIYSTTGQMVYTATAMNSVHKVIVNDYAEGLYIVHVKDTNGNILKTDKIFVSK